MKLSKRNKKLLLSLVFSLVLYGLYTVQSIGGPQTATTVLGQNTPGLYAVTEFVDGDTIAVNMSGKTEKVRFIGIDTPETHKPNTPVQCFGPEASDFTKQTIGSQRVRLVSDPKSTDRDRYNRLLRYVYLADGSNLNKKIIQTGHGFYYPYFPFTESDAFAAAQVEAQTHQRGVWSACSPTKTSRGGYLSNPL